MINKINYSQIDRILKKKGFVIIKNFLSPTETKKYLKKLPIKKIVKNDPAKFHQGASMIYNLQNKDYCFLNLIFDKRINKICESYFKFGSYKDDKDIYQFDSLHSRVLVNISKAQKLHIDSRVCGISPPTHIHFFLYLSDVTKDDGPTRLVPFSHNIKRYPTKKDNIKSVKICEKKGTLIVLNSSIWHGSSEKITNDPRVILTLSYTRWHLRQKYAVPYGIPSKYLKKLNPKQKKILGFFNYPPKNENYRLRMRGELTSLMTR